MDHPTEVGDRSTLAAMLGLKALGYAVLIPFGENTRYDLVIDDGAMLTRVQCKTGRLRGGAVEFPVTSTYAHHRHHATARRAYEGEVDYFAVYRPETSGGYLVPIDAVRTRASARLRITPSRNGQKKRIRHASGYEVAKVSFAAS